jgi:CRISPR-associated protein Csd1
VILQRLYEHRTELDLPPIGYAPSPVHWMIDLDAEGNFEGFVGLPEGRKMEIPTLVRGTDIKPILLADDAEHVFGVAREGATENQRSRVPRKHEAFVDLVRECAEATKEPSVKAVLSFLEGGDVPDEYRTGDFKHGDRFVFRVVDTIPIELESVQGFWAHKLEEQATAGSPVMQCLVTGEARPIPRVLPGSIKGLSGIGGATTGCSLLSAKNASTHHHGREGAHNFPVSWAASERIYSVLNALVAARKKNSIRVGDMIFVFWAKEADTSFFVALDSPPRPEQLADLLGSPFIGREIHGIGGDEFYVVALGAANKRANVRDYFEAPVVRAKANLGRWFDAQRRVGEKLLSVRDLARTCYSDEDKMFSPVVLELMHAAVMEERLPAGLLAKVVARNRAERSVSYERAMLLELYFEYLRGGEMDKETIKTCGRLLAEYEGVRRAAGGDANGQGQYYSVVVNNPARGLAMVEKRTRPYFKRLRREKPGLAYMLEGHIDSLAMAVGAEFPRNLTLEEQGLFALGYRQQRAENAAEIKERVAANEAREQEETQV